MSVTFPLAAVVVVLPLDEPRDLVRDMTLAVKRFLIREHLGKQQPKKLPWKEKRAS